MRIDGKITAIGEKSPDEVCEEYKQKKENEMIKHTTTIKPPRLLIEIGTG